MQGKSLADIRNQIDQLETSIKMKRAEMDTELIDHLTPEEKELLTRLNPEITDLKEKLIACKTDRMDVSRMNSTGSKLWFLLQNFKSFSKHFHL